MCCWLQQVEQKCDRITQPNPSLPFIKKSTFQKNAGGGLSLPCKQNKHKNVFYCQMKPQFLDVDSDFDIVK
jgi:hypothetical protein